MKQLIVDGQILQTDAWHRGMGKYTLQMLCAISNQSDVEVAIIFNTNLAQDAARFEAVKFLCPRMRQVQADLPLASDAQAKVEDYKTALDACIAQSFPGTDNHFLVTSLFFFDFFAEFPRNCKKELLFYDLTPLLFWQDLGGYFPPDMYMARFEKLFEADTVFSISETTRQDLLKVFGLPHNAVVNINGGFTKISEVTVKPTSFKVPDTYILFPTGDLPHKNNEVAVRGFEQYCRKTKSNAKLLITSRFQETSKKQLQMISDNILFTGNVSDEELEWLYEHAGAIIFASKYEGLGMPILDAVASNKPVVTSQIPVFEEMSKHSFYYFEPGSADQLSVALDQAVKRQDFESKAKQYAKILKKYTWENTAHELLAGMAKMTPHTSTTPAKPKLAIACLHPGIKQQVGRVAEQLYASLHQEFAIDYYFDGNGVHYREMERPTFLDYIDCKVFDIAKLNTKTFKKYDHILYLIDAAALPSRVAQRACVLPGIILEEGTFAELGTQEKLLRSVMHENQHQVRSLPDRSFAEYQKVAKLMQSMTQDKREQTPAEIIIRRGLTTKSIINKLKALYT